MVRLFPAVCCDSLNYAWAAGKDCRCAFALHYTALYAGLLLRAGCKRKFDVNKYIAKVDSAIRELNDGKGTGPQNNSMLNYLQPKSGRKK